MRTELDDLLCQRYPDLFRDRHGDPADTSMCWGFCCGDGWYGILDQLCAEITHQVHQQKMPPVVVSQVKEKFGTLRFHIVGGRLRGGNAETHRLIADACQRALTTCEECGASTAAQRQALETDLSVLEQRIALRLDALRTSGNL